MPDRSASDDADDPRIAALQRELADSRAAVAALRREQEVFVQGIAHDLRAPLRGIDRFALLLEQRGALTADDQKLLARIRGAALRMGALLDGLGELANAGHAPLAAAPVDLGALADWVLAELRDAEPARLLHATIAPGLWVLGDERLLRVLLRQLLHNAWKFTPADAPVRIEIRGTRAGGCLRVEIHDAGIGFDPRYAAKLFLPFQRLHGPEQGGGHGLGLAIAQRIVARHGGRIAAESQPGAGSVVLLDLPAAAGPEWRTP